MTGHRSGDTVGRYMDYIWGTVGRSRHPLNHGQAAGVTCLEEPFAFVLSAIFRFPGHHVTVGKCIIGISHIGHEVPCLSLDIFCSRLKSPSPDQATLLCGGHLLTSFSDTSHLLFILIFQRIWQKYLQGLKLSFLSPLIPPPHPPTK